MSAHFFQALYCPPLDASLVAAIANDEGQTLQSAREVLDALAADAGPSTSSTPPRSSASSSPRQADTGSITPGSSSDATSATTAVDIDRMLDEFHLSEKLDHGEDEDARAANLKLTDDEEEPSEGESEQASTSNRSAVLQRSKDDRLKVLPTGAGSDSLAFLSHAFPTRTPEFLQETLADCRGDVGMTIDTLMAIDLVEREEMEDTFSSEAKNGSTSTPDKKGLDYDALAEGSRNVKGKKGRAMRKKAHEDLMRSMGQEVLQPRKGQQTKVTLGDVRQGAKSLPMSASRSARSSRGNVSSHDYAGQQSTEGLTDEELAKRLAKEEDPTAGEAVKDNQWLLTSSVLAQLSTLLDVPPQSVASAYNKASFNLHIAVGRVIDASAADYPTLDSLDEAGSAPSGTAKALVDSLAALAGKSVVMAELALRSTKGRQDAALDLLNLMDVVRDAAGGEKPDELDPLGRLRDGGDVLLPEKKQSTDASSDRAGMSVNVDPLPGESVDLKTLDAARRAGGFARATVAGRNGAPTGQDRAMASLREGATATISFPPGSAATSSSSGSSFIPNATQLMFSEPSYSPSSPARSSRPLSLRQREELISHYRSLAAEYQTRRNTSLLQAGTAWRTASGTNATRGAAFYYADEARRLEAKSRAWSLKAAEELVEYRKAGGGGVGAGRYGGDEGRGGAREGVVDLHGVTVREALSIVSAELNAWWGLPSRSRTSSLTIITGAGRHSPNQVAILTPSVAKWLARQGWRAEVDKSRGVIVVRGLGA